MFYIIMLMFGLGLVASAPTETDRDLVLEFHDYRQSLLTYVDEMDPFLGKFISKLDDKLEPVSMDPIEEQPLVNAAGSLIKEKLAANYEKLNKHDSTFKSKVRREYDAFMMNCDSLISSIERNVGVIENLDSPIIMKMVEKDDLTKEWTRKVKICNEFLARGPEAASKADGESFFLEILDTVRS